MPSIQLLSFILLLFIVFQPRSVLAQSCTLQAEEEANRFLSLAKTFEGQGEWQKAADYYERAALSPCANQSSDGVQGLNRVLTNQNNWLNQWLLELKKFSQALGLLGIQIIGLAIVAFLTIRFILWRIDRSGQWIIMPFEDYTGNNQGEAIAELVSSTIHDIRLLHSDKTIGCIGLSENVDMPTFSSMSYRQNLLSTLSEFNSLDVSGLGFPIGSLLSSTMRWFDLGRPRLNGYIRRSNDGIDITIRKEEGRSGRCTNVWRISRDLGKDKGEVEVIDNLVTLLCFRVLLDAAPGSWGTNSPEAFSEFTNGIRYLSRFYESHSRDQDVLQEARKTFNASILIDPAYQIAKYNLALVELNSGNYEHAIELLKGLLGPSNQHYSIDIYYNLGVAYYQRTRDWAYDRAEEAFNVVLGKSHREPRENRYRETLALTHCGLICVAAQKSRLGNLDRDAIYQKSLKNYQEALKLASGNKIIGAQAKYAMALLYLNFKEFDKVPSLLEESLSLNPYHWRAYTALGQLEMAEKHYEEAIVALSKATALSPEYEYAQYLLGRSYTLLGKHEDEAMTAFSKAPNNARAHDEWGRVFALKKDYLKALEHFEKAIQLNPGLADAYGNVAWYLAEGGLLEGEGGKRAEQAAKKAIELSQGTPSHWHKLAVLGHVYYYEEKIDEARSILNEALLENPEAAQIYYYLALTDMAKNNPAAAKENLVKLLQLKEKGLWHEKAIELMKK